MISYCRHCKGYTTHLSGMCVWANDPRNPHTAPQTNELPAGALSPAPTHDRATDATAAQTVTVYASIRVPLHRGQKRCKVGDAKCTMLKACAPFDMCRFDDVQLVRTVEDGVAVVWPHRGCKI
jgi:hypothetical protein